MVCVSVVVGVLGVSLQGKLVCGSGTERETERGGSSLCLGGHSTTVCALSQAFSSPQEDELPARERTSGWTSPPLIKPSAVWNAGRLEALSPDNMD